MELRVYFYWLVSNHLTIIRHWFILMWFTWIDGIILNLLYCRPVKIMEWKLILQRHIKHYHSSLNPFTGTYYHDLYNAPKHLQDIWIQINFLSKASIFPKAVGHSSHAFSFVREVFSICPSYAEMNHKSGSYGRNLLTNKTTLFIPGRLAIRFINDLRAGASTYNFH